MAMAVARCGCRTWRSAGVGGLRPIRGPQTGHEPMAPASWGTRGGSTSVIASPAPCAAGCYFDFLPAVTEVAVTVPSASAAPATVTESPAFTSFRVPLVAVCTVVLPLVLTVTTSPAAVCT